MAQETTVKKVKSHNGVPMSEKDLKLWQKAFTDIEESIAWCYKHPCKLK